MKVLVAKKSGNIYYYRTKGDYHCKEGFITEKDINSGKNPVFTNLKKEFLVFEANNYDFSNIIKRGPQIITPKDLGYILARSGVDKDSFIVEAGSGSGAATVFFSRFVKKVHSYEVVDKHYDITKKNLETLGIENVKLELGNLADFVEKEKDVDLLFLDMPEPNMVLEKDLKGLKRGKYAICYVPTITQIQDIVSLVAERNDLYLEEITEVIIRNWTVWGKVSRPQSRKEIDHTAFLVFIRKI